MFSKHIILFALLISSSFSSFAQNNAISRKTYTPEKLGYKLVWEDNFDGNSLDTSKWEPRSIGPRRLGYISEEAIKVEDGFLKLYALQKGDTILSGAIGSANHFCPTYGYFECRAQLQESIGVWAAFWMQSTLISQGSDPKKYGAEIDIFEFFKEVGTDTLQHAVHWAYGPNMKSVGPMNSYLKGLSQGFHTFALEWTPKKYVFYIDGLKFHEVKKNISQFNEYLILSMELPNGLEQISQTVFPDVFIVDYVKAYQK